MFLLHPQLLFWLLLGPPVSSFDDTVVRRTYFSKSGRRAWAGQKQEINECHVLFGMRLVGLEQEREERSVKEGLTGMLPTIAPSPGSASPRALLAYRIPGWDEK